MALHTKLKYVARDSVVHSTKKMCRSQNVSWSIRPLAIHRFVLCIQGCINNSIEHAEFIHFPISFFLHNFSISHLYSRTREDIDQEWTALKRSDRDAIDCRRLELKILPSGSLSIGITISK